MPAESALKSVSFVQVFGRDFSAGQGQLLPGPCSGLLSTSYKVDLQMVATYAGLGGARERLRRIEAGHCQCQARDSVVRDMGHNEARHCLYLVFEPSRDFGKV